MRDLVGGLRLSAVDIQHVGSRVAFANAYLTAGGKRIARISGVFANNGQRLEKS